MVNHEEIKKALEAVKQEEDCTLKFEQHQYMKSYVFVSGCIQKKYSHLIANVPTWLRSLLEELEHSEQLVDVWETEANRLTEVNEHITKERDMYQTALHAEQRESVRLSEELERTQSTLIEVESAKQAIHKQWWQIREELKQVKESRDKWEKGYSSRTLRIVEAEAEVESLRSQLAEKDKVLEWYAEEKSYEVYTDPGDEYAMPGIEVLDDRGNHARSVLSQYKETDK